MKMPIAAPISAIGGVALILLAAGAAADGPEAPDGPAIEAGSLPVPPLPPRLAEGARYQQCLDMLDDDPRGALAMAESWPEATPESRDGAAHCRALAEVALG